MTSEGHGTTTSIVAKSDSPAYSLATSILWRCTLPSLLLSWLRRAHPPLYADRTSSHGAVASPARSTASAPRWPRSSAGRKPSIQTDHRNQTGSPFANGWLITLCSWYQATAIGRRPPSRPSAVDVRTRGSAVAITRNRQLAACARVLRIRPWDHVSTVDPRHTAALLRWSRLRNSNTQNRSIVLHDFSNIDVIATIIARFVQVCPWRRRLQ